VKTCKDCVYYVEVPKDDMPRHEYGKCHWIPDGPAVDPSHWCGQLHAEEWGQDTTQTDILNAIYDLRETVSVS
jgi:hypothetical protein